MSINFNLPGSTFFSNLFSKKWFKIELSILSTFLLLATMVVTYGFFNNDYQINFLSSADQNPGLSIWVEPANVILENGSDAELTVMAEFDGAHDTITSLKVSFSPSSFLSLDKPTLDYKKPFNGKVALGKVIVKSNTSGNYKLEIPKQNVTFTDLNNKSITVTTVGSNLTVQ